MNVEHIPANFRDSNRWAISRSKTPYIADGSGKASSTDPSTWRTFGAALAAVNAGAGEALWYALDPESGIVAVDLDKCRDPESGVITPWAQVYVRLLDSYTEVSPSGTGLHVYVRAAKPTDQCKRDLVECYDRSRFMSVTGDHLEGTPTTIEERQAEIEALFTLAFSPKPEPKAKTATAGQKMTAASPSADLSGDTLFAAALRDPKFAHLHRGDTSGYPSPSEARMGYIYKAAFYSRKDAALMDAWLRASSLDQAKWDSKRGDGTLGSFEIGKAINGCSDTYDPDRGPDLGDGLTETQAAVDEAEKIIAGATDCTEHQAALEELRGQLDTCRQQGLEYKHQLEGVKTVLRNEHLTAGRKVVGIVAIFELDRKERRNPGESHLLYRAAIGERAGVSESAAGDALEALAGPGGIFEKNTIYKTFQEVDKQTGEITERRRRVSEFRPTQAGPAAALRTLAAYAPEPEPGKAAWGGKRTPRCADHPYAGVEHFESFRCATCKRLLAGHEYVPTDHEGDLSGQVAPIETTPASVVNTNGHLDSIGHLDPMRPATRGVTNQHLDPIGVQQAQAELIRLGALLGYPELPIKKGHGIAGGEHNWRRFAEYANGTLTMALDAAAAQSQGVAL